MDMVPAQAQFENGPAPSAPPAYVFKLTAGVWVCLALSFGGLALTVLGAVRHAALASAATDAQAQYATQQAKTRQAQADLDAAQKTLTDRRAQIAKLDDAVQAADAAVQNQFRRPAPVDPRVDLQAQVASLVAERTSLTAENAQLKSQPRMTVETVAKLRKPSVVIVENGDVGFGTGFVVDGSRVVTNFHVIREDPEITVKYLVAGGTAGQPKFVACKSVKVLAVNKARDLALLQVDFGGPGPAALTLQPEIEQGEKVCAIGNPGLGGEMLEETVSEGIVSGLNRQVNGQRFHQVTAAINPGNSGGPVFNMKGEVVGVVTLKGNGVDNMGFVIPAADVQAFLADWQAFKIPGAYEDFLIQIDPLRFRLRKIRQAASKFVTSTTISYAISDAAVDAAGHLWLADADGNRLVAYDEKTLKKVREIPLSNRPVAMCVNYESGLAFVMAAGGKRVMKVSLGTGQEVESFNLDEACHPILERLDSENMLTVNMRGGLALVNIATKKYVDLSRAFTLQGVQPLTIAVGTRSVDIVGLDAQSQSLVVRSDTVARVRNLATQINQADQARTQEGWNMIAAQIARAKYFTTESQVAMRYVHDERALYAFHEGPNNTCYLGNGILKGPAPYKSSGTLPSMLEALGAEGQANQMTELENLYCVSPDQRYGATALAIYDLNTNKIAMPLPFVSNQTMFSHDGRTLFCFSNEEDGSHKLYRFPWKDVPAFDWQGKGGDAANATPAHAPAPAPDAQDAPDLP